jgi:hypothetical protein
VSQFDVYVGHLLRCSFGAKPDALNASNKTITYSQLIGFASFDAAKEHVIEKEVETVLRASHADQFDWLENRLGIPLRNPLPAWPAFVEVTERRSLFAME